MPKLRVYLFGKLKIYRDDKEIESLDVRKAQELLCYLLLYRNQWYPREKLVGTLWGDMSAMQAKKCMRQTLWQLQSALTTQCEAVEERLILVASDSIRINPNADVWIDVAEFERGFEQVKGCRGEQLEQSTAQLARNSVQLYGSDLLEGWYQDWCIYERDRLQNIYLAMVEKLMVYDEAQGEYDAALNYGSQILRYDRAHERTHRHLMRLHYLAGDRASALRQYQRCVAVLQEELGVQPSRHTTALYEQIQADRDDSAPTETGPIRSPPHGGSMSLHALLARLKQRWRTLTDLERQIREDIDSLERALKYQGEETHQP